MITINLRLKSQSDVEETVTVVKKTTTCEICGVAFKGIKMISFISLL